MSDTIRVIVFQDCDQWVAQGLECDICAQAKSLDDLYDRFDLTVQLEASETGGLGRIPPAPKHFFDLWDRQSGKFEPANDGANQYDFALAA